MVLKKFWWHKKFAICLVVHWEQPGFMILKSRIYFENRTDTLIFANQWTKALFAYIKSNLWSSLAQASAIAVVLDNMHTALCTFARSPPGTTVGGW